MTKFDCIYAIFMLLAVTIVIIAWLGTKYDVVGREEEIKRLNNEIQKLHDKEARRKKKNIQKKKALQKVTK